MMALQVCPVFDHSALYSNLLDLALISMKQIGKKVFEKLDLGLQGWHNL